MVLKFEAHGIRTSEGLNRCSYILSTNQDGSTAITIYAKGYRQLDSEIREAFTVKNGSDIERDYVETDRIRVLPDHPLFLEVVQGFRKSLQFRIKTGGRGRDYAALTLLNLEAYARQDSADSKQSVKSKRGVGM